jgi:hypothetical protein
LLIFTTGDRIEASEVRKVLPGRTTGAPPGAGESLLYSRLEDTEKELILKVLEENRWQISKAAQILGLERSHLYKKMKRYGIARPFVGSSKFQDFQASNRCGSCNKDFQCICPGSPFSISLRSGSGFS